MGQFHHDRDTGCNASPVIRRPSMLLVAALTCVGLTASVAVAAPTPILPIDPATQLANSPGPGQYFGFTDINIDGTYAWSFQVLQTVQVVGLGWYDDGADGLSHDHAVGLSGDVPAPSPVAASNLLSTTIPAGTGASLIGSYRVELNAPLTLTPGVYAISGWDFTANPDPVKFAGASVPTDSRIAPMPTPLRGDYSGANVELLAPGAWLGPMVFVQPAPEPSTLVLAALAIVGAVAYRRRRA